MRGLEYWSDVAIDEWSWRAKGNCRQWPPEFFFPEDHGRAGRRGREERAKQICAQCPVLTPCRDYALATGETHGVWGALSSRERKMLLIETAHGGSPSD